VFECWPKTRGDDLDHGYLLGSCCTKFIQHKAAGYGNEGHLQSFPTKSIEVIAHGRQQLLLLYSVPTSALVNPGRMHHQGSGRLHPPSPLARGLPYRDGEKTRQAHSPVLSVHSSDKVSWDDLPQQASVQQLRAKSVEQASGAVEAILVSVAIHGQHCAPRG
jgi:hypothetical protein